MATEELVLVDKVSAAAEAMAASVEAVAGAQNAATAATGAFTAAQNAAAAAASKLAAATDKLNSEIATGVFDPKASAAVGRLKEKASEAAAAVKQLGDAQKSASRNVVTATRDMNKNALALENARGALTKGKGVNVAPEAAMSAAAFGKMSVAIGLVGGALKGAWGIAKGFFKEVGGAIVGFVTGISDAKIANDKLRASLNQMTKGKGLDAMAHLAKLAKALGQTTQGVADQFVAFREQGLNNLQSDKLIKLRADLDATGVSAGVADKAMSEAVKALKGGAKVEDVVKTIAKQFGAAGDGANAAAKRGASWEGAIDNIGQAWDRVKARIANAVGPALDRLGTKFTAFLDKAEASGELDSFIDGIGEALEDIDSVITDVQSAFTAVKDAATGFFEGLDSSGGVETLVEGIRSLGEAFGGTSGATTNATATGQAFGEAAGALAGALGLLASAIAGVISMIGALKNALNGGVGDMKQSSTQVEMSAGKWEAAGANAGQGFANGIKAKTGEVSSAAAGLGAAADASLAAAIEAHSPSRVAARYGVNFGQSFADAMNDTLPTEVAAPMPSDDVTGAAMRAPAGATPAISITVNVTDSNASADDIAVAIRREIESHLRMVS